MCVIYIKLHLPQILNYFFPGWIFCIVLTGSPGRDSPLGPCGPGGPIEPGSPKSPRGPIGPYSITRTKSEDVSKPHSYKKTTLFRFFYSTNIKNERQQWKRAFKVQITFRKDLQSISEFRCVQLVCKLM